MNKIATRAIGSAGAAVRALNPKLFGASTGKPLKTYENNFAGLLSNPLIECNEATTLGATIQRKAKGDDRARIRFTGCRVRPLDPDNFAGSVKDLLDGLRHSGIISGDEPWKMILETDQQRVASFKDEYTEIEIDLKSVK